jgi:hypothetical protein
LTNDSDGKPEQNSDAAFKQTLELVIVFKEASRNCSIIFLFHMAA